MYSIENIVVFNTSDYVFLLLNNVVLLPTRPNNVQVALGHLCTC